MTDEEIYKKYKGFHFLATNLKLTEPGEPSGWIGGTVRYYSKNYQKMSKSVQRVAVGYQRVAEIPRAAGMPNIWKTGNEYMLSSYAVIIIDSTVRLTARGDFGLEVSGWDFMNMKAEYESIWAAVLNSGRYADITERTVVDAVHEVLTTRYGLTPSRYGIVFEIVEKDDSRVFRLEGA